MQLLLFMGARVSLLSPLSIKEGRFSLLSNMTFFSLLFIKERTCKKC